MRPSRRQPITGRSDIHSSTRVLYAMLTGNPPHTGATAQQITAPVTKLRRNLPPNVAAAVAKVLEKLPADRFGSAREFADALSNPAFTVASSTRGSTAELRLRGISWRWFLATAGIAVIALAAAAAGWLRREPVAEPIRFALMLPDGEQLSSTTPSLVGRV
jgi:serine/threonine-protein kinase